MKEWLNELLEELYKSSTLEETENKKLLSEIDSFHHLNYCLMQQNGKKDVVLCEISEKLDKFDLYKGCCIAHFCGYLIENIGLEESGQYLVEFFVKVVKKSYEYLIQAAKQLDMELDDLEIEELQQVDVSLLFTQEPDLLRAYRGLDMITLAVMDVITRSPECRLQLRRHHIHNQMEELRNFNSNIFYPLQVVDACASMQLVVLSPEKGKGLIAKVNDLNNNFQLITFLEMELSKHQLADVYSLTDYVFNQNIYNFATGAAYPKDSSSVTAHAYYTSYEGTMIWGEMPPESIPCIGDMPVILIHQKGIARSWDTNFILKWHEALTPYFQIDRELSEEEFKNWMQKINEVT